MSAMNWQPDYKHDFAVKFARFKVGPRGEFPKSIEELAQWFLEYNAEFGKLYDAMFEAYREHMNNCVRPVILNLEHFKQGGKL